MTYECSCGHKFEVNKSRQNQSKLICPSCGGVHTKSDLRGGIREMLFQDVEPHEEVEEAASEHFRKTFGGHDEVDADEYARENSDASE